MYRGHRHRHGWCRNLAGRHLGLDNDRRRESVLDEKLSVGAVRAVLRECATQHPACRNVTDLDQLNSELVFGGNPWMRCPVTTLQIRESHRRIVFDNSDSNIGN
ncbi:hypothetical protein P355_5370 [Burkholderia cenocepacia KC-01]|nr:hypothetical protein P355_5370 [Burkholderia cenocepacia KC-01]